MLRYNGLYISSQKSGNGHPPRSFLRFYHDGLVIEVASTDTPEEVVKWFHRGNASFSRGFYIEQDGRIHFAVISHPGVLYFTGEVLDACLKLTCHSHIDGNTEDTQYSFMAL